MLKTGWRKKYIILFTLIGFGQSNDNFWTCEAFLIRTLSLHPHIHHPMIADMIRNKKPN